jgi:hypothetical protein
VRLVLPAALAAAFVAGCGGHGTPAATSRATPTSSSILVRLTAQSHHPRVGKRWSYEVRVTDRAGKPVPVTVHLQILFGGVPVGQVGRHRVADGVWREILGTPGNPPFPASARGQPLVFQAVVTAKGQTKKANWWIRVK